MTTPAFATCPLCEAICGIAVTVDGDRVVQVRGDPDDPFSRGYICPKAVALEDMHHDPDRLRAPLRRTGTRWQVVGWDEALDEAATRLASVQKEHGDDAVALYIGNPTAHSYSAILFGLLFAKTLRTRSLFSSNSVDALPRLLASFFLYGSQAVVPVPDIDRTDFLLVLGANPIVSNGSVMTAPDCKRRLTELRARGGRLVVVDPRRTETAALADEHHFIRPGTDALLLAALIHVIYEEGLARQNRAVVLIEGRRDLTRAVAPFSPACVEAAVGIPAESIRRLARAFAGARSAVCYGRLGTCTQDFGTVTAWLIDALNAVTGNLDRPGGAMFTTPAVDLASLAGWLGQSGQFGRWRSRVRGLPEFNGELPVATLAEEMETPGRGQIRALVTHAGNPVLSVPNGRRLDKALESLDFMVSIDLYRNESTRHANLILPTTFALEHDHYPLLFHALAVRNTVKYSRAVLPRPTGLRHDWEILLDLACGLLSRRGLAGRALAGPVRWLGRRLGPQAVLRLLMRLGPHGLGRRGGPALTFGQVEKAPHGMDLGPLEPRLSALVRGRPVRLAPRPLTLDLERLAERLETSARVAATPGTLLLIGRRQLRSNNSWMHNTLRLVRGRNRCTLLMHPDDAARRCLAAGRTARIASGVGAIEAEVEVSDEMMPGVVSLPHGWGHGQKGTQLSIASAHAGVSLNELTSDAQVDALSGCASFSGVEVEVEAVGATAMEPAAG